MNLKYKTPVCHPERKHHAHGLCGSCYNNKDYQKAYREKYKEKQRIYMQTYNTLHKKETAQYAFEHKKDLAAYKVNKRITNINFKLSCILRNRLWCATKNNQKVGSAIDDLGCSIQHFKLHLELFWDEGMSWDNYGNKEGQWNIDHIIPLSKVDLTDREQFLKVNHYTNLQPMWHIDNIKKSNKL